MNCAKKPCLPHLPYEVVSDVLNGLNSYPIFLEAWRRGLKVTIRKDYYRYSISSSERTRNFIKSMVLDEELGLRGHKICKNKGDAKKYLTDANVPVPKGMRFDSNSPNQEIIDFAKSLGFPVVLKPTDGGNGKGVILDVNEESIQKELIYLRQTLNRPDVVVEEQLDGEDVRVWVIGDKVVGAITRIAANIIGNGQDSVERLIKQKNKARKKIPSQSKKLIRIDREVLSNLELVGYSLESVPKQGEQVFLRNNCNTTTGGDAIEITDSIPESIRRVAINAVKAIPGLHHAGVDILYNRDDQHNTGGIVIEINSMSQFAFLLFPVNGTPRDMPSLLIDYYFPESFEGKDKNRNIYINLRNAMRPIKEGVASDVTLVPVPTDYTVFKKYIIKGHIQGVGFRKWVQREALKFNISGSVKNLKSGNIQIVAAGSEKNMENFKAKCFVGPKKARVESISEKIWKRPVKAGFEILDMHSKFIEGNSGTNLQNRELKNVVEELTQKIQVLLNTNSELEQKNQDLLLNIQNLKVDLKASEVEYKRLKKKYKKIKKSRIWRYSMPIRKLASMLSSVLP